MFRNYIKIALRNLVRNRAFSIINIVGLSLSVSFCLLLYFYIRHEQSYDSFHEKKSSLFRFERTNTFPSSEPPAKPGIFGFLTKGNEVENELVTSLVIGRDIQQHFPEVKSITRLQDQGDGMVKIDKTIFKEKHILYADENFFQNFSFPIIKGNAKGLASSPSNLILSESAARKYFGTTEVIGKTIELVGDSSRLFTIAAIAADAPINSSIQFNIVLPLMADPDYPENINQGFNHSSHLLFLELNKDVSPTVFAAKLNVWAKKYFLEPYIAAYGKWLKDVDFTHYQWYLRPLPDCHYNISSPWGHYTDAKNMYQLACLVIIILIIASLNYVLLVISNAAARSQEIGVRKVLGAGRRKIIIQFWVETQLVICIAVIIGLGITNLLLPLFNKIIGSDLQLSAFSWRETIPAVVLLCMLLGLLAGYYPAMVLSRMKPVTIIKSFSTFKINPLFSKIMVVMQYTACVTLMVAAFIINRQMQYINNKDLGFDKDQVLMVSNPTYDFAFTNQIKSRLRDFAKTQPYISHYSGMNGSLDGSYNTNGFKLNGEQKWRKEFTVDFGYFEMLGVKFVQGRPFSASFPTDTAKNVHACVVNETLFSLLGNQAKLGVYCEPINATIIGIVKDYHFETLSKKIEPEEHVLARGYVSNFMFKVKAGKMQEAIEKIGKEWKSLTDYPFEYTFLDTSISKMYEADQRWEKTIQASCFFAIFIACMGLFGLSAINAINRTREIGIRKILGASVNNIVGTLSSSFLVMVSISILIATPLSWWIMSHWLENFAYRIQISWWMFAAVAVMALCIALATVSIQAIKAAMANPVKSLRAE